MVILTLIYKTVPGRFVLKALASPGLSKASGRFLDSRASRCLITPFIKVNRINMRDFPTKKYRNFNEFFSRKIRSVCRPIDYNPRNFIAPCDGLLRVYPIKKGKVFPVKEASYTMRDLLRSEKLAKYYEGGFLFVYRLTVRHYHRYLFAETGTLILNRKIPGKFHTVKPIALQSRPVFVENSREYSLIRTELFGTIMQMEVGAMLVGRIRNWHDNCQAGAPAIVSRGQEKGFFQYGGSTVIVAIPKGKIKARLDLIENSKMGLETEVKMGQTVGTFKDIANLIDL